MEHYFSILILMIFVIQRGEDLWAMFKEFEIEYSFESYTNYQHDSWIKWEKIICRKFYIDSKHYFIYEYLQSLQSVLEVWMSEEGKPNYLINYELNNSFV
jgi:hypothetical protein